MLMFFHVNGITAPWYKGSARELSSCGLLQCVMQWMENKRGFWRSRDRWGTAERLYRPLGTLIRLHRLVNTHIHTHIHSWLWEIQNSLRSLHLTDKLTQTDPVSTGRGVILSQRSCSSDVGQQRRLLLYEPVAMPLPSCLSCTDTQTKQEEEASKGNDMHSGTSSTRKCQHGLRASRCFQHTRLLVNPDNSPVPVSM